MLFLINKFKAAFNIDNAAKILRIEFKKVAEQVKKSFLINKFKPALNSAMQQKKGALNLKNKQSKDKKVKRK